jgi:hypothetical protein
VTTRLLGYGHHAGTQSIGRLDAQGSVTSHRHTGG